MTSYMYNPSKQVTKLLEEYLEFDAEQLKLGIWSGRLSLKDVNLKADAFYPHLNQFFEEAAQSEEFTKSKPPVRIKLVSGSIGELNLDIPWKSLVWGQGDVKVDLRNVVVVVALESLEETQQRCQQADESEESGSGPNNQREDANESQEDQAAKARKRYQKQKILREAERRQLQGRDIASWLERVSKKEEEARQREAIRAGDPLVQQEGRLRTWLKGATSDFFWRFYAGLQMKIENLKIVCVQDTMEIGLIIPSTQVLAGKQQTEQNQNQPALAGSRRSASSHEDEAPEQSNTAHFEKPPQNVVYESPDEDGEHADKHIRILGLGVYIRKLSSASKKKLHEQALLGDKDTSGATNLFQLSDVSTKEYVLRPTELNVSYSLFFPYPPEKRKKKKQAIAAAAAATEARVVAGPASSVAPSTNSQSTGSTGKRRRGKREKSSIGTADSTTTTSPSTDPKAALPAAPFSPVKPSRVPSGGLAMAAGSGPIRSNSSHGPAPSPMPKRNMVMRRMSIQTGVRKPVAAQPITTPSTEIPPAPAYKPQSLTSSASSSLAQSSTEGGSTAMSTTQRTESTGDQPTQLPAAPQLDGTQPAPVNKPRFARRSSIAGPVKGSSAAAAVVSRVPRTNSLKTNRRSMPLARPDDDILSSQSQGNKDMELTARVDGNVQVGPLEVVLSSRHFHLMDDFLSATARMRNGRPSQTISSVLEVKPVRHSVLVTSSELARATSVSTDAAETVRLGLNAPLNDRSDVVRSWWRYGLYAIRWEIQQRRKVRKHFQDKYLSFSWEQQRQHRKEYVTMYISAKLLSPEEEGAQATNPQITEALASIEDELCIEQILLYRAVARILHVGGLRQMPDTLVGIRATAGYRDRASSDDKSPAERRSFQRSSSGFSSDEGGGFDRGEHNRTMLSLLEETCEISRMRMEGGHGEILPRHRALINSSVLDYKSGVGDSSTLGMTLDTRGGRGGAGFSRATTRRSAGNRSTYSDESTTNNTSMKFSFKGSLEKVELMVVEEDVQYDGYGHNNRQTKKDGDDDHSSEPHSATTVSEISELTEEERFSDSATQMTGMDDESVSDPIMASTDFLLFRQPEKVLLRTEVRNLTYSAAGQATGSRTLHFNIGCIQAVAGNSDLKLLEIGTDGDGFVGSDSAVGSRGVPLELDESVGGVNTERQGALSLSLVLQKDQQVVQCDIATVKATLDVHAIASLIQFGSSSRSPRPLMPTTPGESVRMYVVNQNIGTSFRFFDASLRLHGIEILLPPQLGGGRVSKGAKEGNGLMLGEDSASDSADTVTRATFVADMVEVYSGKAANKLGVVKAHWHDAYNAARLSVLGEEEERGNRSTKTRHLQMIDVDELISKKSAFLAFNVVAAVTGLDFVVGTHTKGGVEESRLSFFDAPVDVEFFGSVNESSVLDYNRAKREIVVKVSEVNAMVSETRLRMLAQVFPEEGIPLHGTLSEVAEKEMIPPRMEILARLMLNSFDINVARLRLSLVTDDQGRVGHSMVSKADQLEDFVTDFLRTVSKLDLSWPHEEALSSAMQICIDRLTGIGFQLDDAWQCANTALLNFLEDIAIDHQEGESETGDELIDILIHGSVGRTVVVFADRFDQSEPTGHLVENHLVIDFPEGVSVTAVDLFYDHFAAAVVNSVFVTNGEGIHLLRLMPEVGQVEGSEKNDLDARSDAVASYSSSKSGSSESNPALVCRWFRVNEKYSFGRGGLPLSVLGGEIEEVKDVLEEDMVDADCGDLELLFCEEVFDDVLYSVSQICDPLEDFLKSLSGKQSGGTPGKEPSHMLVSSSCFSLLFTNEDLVPFSRFILGHCVLSSESKRGSGTVSTKLSAKQLSLLYLAPDGELYPEQVCVHEMSPGPPVTVFLDTSDSGDSLCRVEFRGARVYMVYQYIAECLQYFYSGTVGFGLWLANSSEALSKFQTNSAEETSFTTELFFFDCSVLMPKSSLSSEMISLEVDKIRITMEKLEESFRMPSNEHPLQLMPNPGSSSDSAWVSRTNIELHRLRIYSALSQAGVVQDSSPRNAAERESLAFNCFFEIDGRAEENKRVYHQIAPPQNYEIEEDKADRHWREITSGASNLKVIVDYAPHLRILVTDEIEGTRTPLSLDVTLTQFCLLMSCWFANMSELPTMFPYDASDIEVGSKFIAKAATFPEFGTEQYRKVMESAATSTSEFMMSLSSLALRCTTDRQFETVTTEAKGILLGLDHCTLHVTNDTAGVTKVGLGALGAHLVDDDKAHRQVLEVKNNVQHQNSFADLTFGTSGNCNGMIEDLPLPFQMSVFMAPKAALYNLGMDSAVLTVADFSTLFGFLGFVSVYFCEQELGYPSLRAAEFLAETKKGIVGDSAGDDEPPSDYLTDFRLWLTRPALWIPVEPDSSETQFLILATDQGLWYRCATIDLFLSQECIVKGLMLSFVEQEDAKKRQLSLRSTGKTLIEGLSFGLRIDYNGTTNHTDYSLKIPYNDEWGCSIISKRIAIDPVVIQRPKICNPLETLDRFLGPKICEITCEIDVLPATYSALSNLFVGAAEADDTSGDPSQSTGSQESVDTDASDGETEDDPEPTFSFSGALRDIRVFTLDPVLGPHLPVAVVSVADFSITASKFSAATEEEPHRGEAPPEDLQLYINGNMWADSFKLGLTRSWEPLLEAYRFRMFYENSKYRGSGVHLHSDVPLHLNITGANLLVVDEVADSILRQVNETFGSGGTSSRESSSRELVPPATLARERVRATEEVQGLAVVHEFPKTLSHGDRVAFSLKNMTGQFLRAYRLDASESDGARTATLSYVENESATRLLFQPSVSMVANMEIVEVEFPGLENSPNHNFGGSGGSLHELDIQIPGFKWMRGVKIDNFGRHFVSLTPRSSLLRDRAADDWRIGNVMKLLVEVGLENGGRELTARSIFSVANKTTHDLSVLFHPNASFRPGLVEEEGVYVESNGIHQIPVLLMESALRLSAAASLELGCLWLRPRTGSLPSNFGEEGKDDLVAQFSSRPVKLGKLVNDSALLFEANKGEDISPDQAETGVQISCPVIGGSGERELAPFCYAVEVGRSPIVRAREGDRKSEPGHVHIHGPVAYTLSVYAPFVIANLLPEAGRFELMHAVRKTMLWFADLEPGQQVSVHSVGLDAPLLLLINLRFCRTPIGEGALVHHGPDPPADAREHLSRLRSLGKAGKAVTKQLGKTLTSLGDTPDKRGQERIFTAQDRENRPAGVREKKKTHNQKPPTVASGDLGIEDVDGKTYRVDTTVFFPENCVDETVVVDGVGQRLTLGIENFRGGGGQRRVTVYCPFWIVNSTEHSLMYRQYNSKHCVSGSVVNPQMDGSLTLSGGHVGMKSGFQRADGAGDSSVRPVNDGTIFAGTPGALATSPGTCDLRPERLAPLLQENLSLDDLSRCAFMFNFHEGSYPGGNQRICVQLSDGRSTSKRYQSDWSRGVGLDSVGISQVVDMNCKDGRSLELSMVTQAAPGHLAKYTKIVRFLPRYVVVNNLPHPIRLWQDNSIFRPPSAADVTLVSTTRGLTRRWRLVSNRRKKDTGKINQYEALWGREVDILADETDFSFPEGTTAHPSALYVMSVPPATWKPFNLPDSRGDRQLRVGLGGSYNLTASISADVPGEHTLRLTRAVDLRLLKHVSTRASPQYNITLPPPRSGDFSGELGIWFETEWGTDRSLIVKAIRYDSYCYNKTDVHVGDELLLIDGAPVARMTFAEAMNVLRTRIGEIRAPGNDTRRLSARRSSLRFGLSTRFSSQSVVESESGGTNRTLTLTFRTVEERLRRVRLKAARNNATGSNQNKLREPSSILESASGETGSRGDPAFLKAELKTLHKSMYLVLGTIGAVPYEVHNRTQSSTVYFRQRGCYSHPWRTLKPGASEVYCWEEPMKAKRLMVRVATEDSFVFVSQRDQGEKDSQRDKESESDGLSETAEVAEIGRSAPAKHVMSVNVKDEEDSVFSPSASVRLEEIGFRDYLHYSPGGGSKLKHLELEVDVVGSTRVLVVRDISAESDSEDQMINHLAALRAKCVEEEERMQHIRSLRTQLPTTQNAEDAKEEDIAATREVTDAAKNLMNDFPEEKSITRVHQMVVEVLEATGLSPDNYVGVCNPYVEVSLRSASNGRTNLFQSTKQYHRTYWVRRSISPQWNSQSFIFDIPSEAVSITRGHAVKVKVRNFRRIGRHAILGRAQIDLHSVKGNSPLLGWFPLAGRTGRRELENSLSHWGRGSIKLRIHWVYSAPALLDYLSILSETRLADLHESVDGMAGQLDKRREEERKRQERIDGFNTVRVNDLGQRKLSTPNNFQPRIMRMEVDLGNSHKRTTDQSQAHNETGEQKTLVDAAGLRRNSTVTPRHAPSMRHDVEDQISMRRQQLQRGALGVSRRASNFLTSGPLGDSVSIAAFRSWEEAKVFFNDESLDISYDGQEFNLRLRRQPAQPSPSTEDSAEERQLAGKLHVPKDAPSLMRAAANEHSRDFAISRSSLEKFARSSLRAALNPGGWLTIRPIQALNLPDSFHGMFVKVKYGSESFVSETVDSTVYPTWFKPETQEPVSAESLEYFPGDLHIFVPPQKTSGSIRLSVVGEGQGQRLNTKTELGVLHIPLGAAITACIDCVEEYFDSQMGEDGSSPVYLRWFPLADPKATLPVEGDRKNGCRPRESEKESDNMFQDYFTPCIQLALIWSPEVDSLGGGDMGGDIHENENAVAGNAGPVANRSSVFHNQGVSSRSEKSNQTSMVESYCNADIGQVSFALIDSTHARELISGCICDVDVRYWVTKAKTRFGVSVGWFQLDQQDDYCREPVILAPTPAEYIATVFQILALKDNLRSKNDVLSFEFIDFSIAEFDVTLEETLLSDVADFLSSLRLKGALSGENTQNEGTVEDLSTFGDNKSLFDLGNAHSTALESPLLSLLSDGGSDETKGRQRVYIEQLFLGVVKFNLSYLKGTKETRTVIEEQLGGIGGRAQDAGDRVFGMGLPSSHHAKSDIFSMWSQDTAADSSGRFMLPSIFTSLLPTVSDAPVRLQGKALNHVFESPGEIIQSIRKFYVNETLKQIYKIIGSLDFVGNPTMLFTSFLSGLRDLILVPSQAIMKSPNPSSVGLGFAKGTLSLFSHSISGFFGFTSKIFAAAGQFLAALSCDRDFRTWHRDHVLAEAGNLNRTWKKRGVQSVRRMIVRPLGDIAIGLGSGLVGVVLSPIRGYRRSGNLGLVKGVAAGSAGILIKPTVGVLDALSHFTASIYDIAKSVNVLEKRFQPPIKYRLPYVFGSSNILMSFGDADARASYLLRLFPLRTGRRNAEHHSETLVHVEVLQNINVETYAVVTSARLILIRLKTGGTGSGAPTLCWQVAIVGNATVSSQVAEHGHNGFALTITLKKKPTQEQDASERQSGSESLALSNGSGESDSSALNDALIDAAFEPGTEDFDHGTSRGESGELLEWFTVVAEYQYRRQLAKLHNAISCVAGNLQDVINDPSLGRPGSTQSYTSFGIFHFEPTRSDEDSEYTKTPFDNYLEELPWHLDNEYRSGEPEWLLIARRRAANAVLEMSMPSEHNNQESSNRPSANPPAPGRVRKIARWIKDRLPTIIDTEEEHASPSRNDNTAGPVPKENEGQETRPSDTALPRRVDRSQSFESIGGESFMTANEEMLSLRESSSGSMSASRHDSSISTPNNSFMTARRESFSTSESFMTARKAVSFSSRTPVAAMERGGSTESLDESMQVFGTPAASPPDRLSSSDQTELHSNNGNLSSSDQTEVHSNNGSELPGHSDTHIAHEGSQIQAPLAADVRLERMENIMEQLLLFSSEQALRNMANRSPIHATTGDDALQEEIRALRAQLQQQNEAERRAHDEIEKLRQEVSALNGIVASRGAEDRPQKASSALDVATTEDHDIDGEARETSTDGLPPDY